MFKKLSVLVLAVTFMVSLSGCATTRKTSEMDDLRNQVTTLQYQLQSKDQEISSLRDELSRAEQEAQAKTVEKVSSCRMSNKDIQTALAKAGYYSGSIDGKIGKGTRKAIKEFQAANNLGADGKVGKRTLKLLMPYLDKQIK